MLLVSIAAVLLSVLVLIANKKQSKVTETSEVSTMSSSGIAIRPFSRLGAANHGWLNTRHHFSFADYFDMNRMQWGALRVINDDIIAPGGGFPPHPHRNMEIVTYLLDKNVHPSTNKVEGGEGISHRDSTGSDGITLPGDVQVMSVGTSGVVHSEFHPDSKSNRSTNLLQIWITPDKRVDKTTWGTRHFPKENSDNRFAIFASGFAEDLEKGALPINSYTRVVGARLDKSNPIKYTLGKNRLGYAVVINGPVNVNSVKASSHDGIAIKDTEELVFESLGETCDILLIDTHP